MVGVGVGLVGWGGEGREYEDGPWTEYDWGGCTGRKTDGRDVQINVVLESSVLGSQARNLEIT